MKKVYFIAALLTVSTAFAQISLSAVSTASSQSVAKSENLIYDQPIAGNNGIISDIDDTTGRAVYSADDFTLTAKSNITTISFTGFQNLGDFLARYKGLAYYVYSDASGVPSGIPGNDDGVILSSAILTASSTAVTITQPSTGQVVLTIDVLAASGRPLVAEANTKYWVVVAPRLATTTLFAGPERWNWYVGTVVGSKSKLADPTNAFGPGGNVWRDVSVLTGDAAFDGLAFSLDGAILGTSETSSKKISTLYPNPAADMVQVKSDSFAGAEVFDATGRLVLKSKTENINVSSLKKGVYMVKVTGKDGVTSSTKLIKK